MKWDDPFVLYRRQVCLLFRRFLTCPSRSTVGRWALGVELRTSNWLARRAWRAQPGAAPGRCPGWGRRKDSVLCRSARAARNRSSKPSRVRRREKVSTLASLQDAGPKERLNPGHRRTAQPFWGLLALQARSRRSRCPRGFPWATHDLALCSGTLFHPAPARTAIKRGGKGKDFGPKLKIRPWRWTRRACPIAVRQAESCDTCISVSTPRRPRRHHCSFLNALAGKSM